MAISEQDFAAYLERINWPPQGTTYQDIGRDIESLLNVILDRAAAGAVKPRPPPRRAEEVLALISWLVWTGQPPNKGY